MKVIKLILASLVLCSSAKAAVTINLSGNPTTGPVWNVPETGLVKDGSLIRVGTFATAPAANATFADLEAAFSEFGRSTVGTDNVNGANTGHIQRSNIAGIEGGTSTQPDSFFATKQVYIWVYSTTASDATSPQGVFGSGTVFADQATAVSVSMSSFLNAYGTLAGGVAAKTTNGTSYSLSYVPVPEPSTGLLAFAALGLLGKRRRR